MFDGSLPRSATRYSAILKRRPAHSRPMQTKHRLQLEPLEPRCMLDGGLAAGGGAAGGAFPAAEPDWTDLRITEIMYRPAPPSQEELDAGFLDNEGDDFEFVELQNTGSVDLVMTGVKFTAGLTFAFVKDAFGDDVTLAPNEHVVLARNPAGVAFRYDDAESLAFVSGGLNNGGERLRLEGPSGGVISEFRYDNDWYELTHGRGHSLVVLDPAGDLATLGTKEAWRPSAQLGGSPGAEDPHVLAPGSIVINEVLAHTDRADGDWIELYNTTDQTIDIGGWFLSDEDGDELELMKYEIPAGTEIRANEYLVFTQMADFGAAFAFFELGEEAHISSAVGGTLSGYRYSVQFGPSDREVTLGPHTPSTEEPEAKLVALAHPTPRAANAEPLVSNVVINEIMYHPPLGGDEFIELHNRTPFPVVMYDPFNRVNTWRISGIGGDGDDKHFYLPSNTVLGGGSYALIVPIEPSVFRQKYDIDSGVLILGPYPGALQDSGETLVLSRPGDPEPITRIVPYYVADRVRYNDKHPWPITADGDGPALMRVDPAAYANEPQNWSASTPGGTPGEANAAQDATPPTAPMGLAATAPDATRIRLDWAPSSDPETGVSEYRIYRNAGVHPIGVSPVASFIDRAVAAQTLYTYHVAAVNGDGLEGPKESVAARIMAIDSVTVADERHVEVAFSEPVTANKVHYTITGANIAAAALDPLDQWTVVLTTSSALLEDQTYTLTVSNVRGQLGGIIPPGTQEQFLVDLVTPDPTPPTVPRGVSATVPDATQIHLTWNAASDPESGISEYRIYRTDNGDLPIGISATTSFTDDGVASKTTYAYRVSAVNGEGIEGLRTEVFDVRIMEIDAVSVADASHVEVTFSESVLLALPANYTIAGASVTAAAYDPQDNRTIVLSTASPLNEDQTYTLTATDIYGLTGGILPPDTQKQFLVDLVGPGEASIEGRYVFYNGCAFDDNDTAASAADDAAIATDKEALRPGQIASLANYTSYSKGVNGIMVDVADPAGQITARNFRFRMGNSQDVDGWGTAPGPSSVVVRNGEGVGGSDRVTITWADQSIAKQWLEVTVVATGIGLPGDDVFYFGNAVAEAGNSSNTQVTTTDVLLARNNPRNFLNPAGIEFLYDYNRDQRVNATDVLLARNNQTNFLTALKRLDLSDVAGAAPAETAWIAEFGLLADDDPASDADPAAGAVDRLLMDYWP